MSRHIRWQLIMTIGIAALIVTGLPGCGGGGNGGGEDDNTGSVSGQVLYFISDQGLGGVTLTVGGKSAVSTAGAGNFTITGIAPASNQVLTVTIPPDTSLALPSDEPILVDVTANETYPLAAPIRLIDSGDKPPDPWS